MIDGRLMNLRMPFAENGERDILSGTSWQMAEHGKGDPASLWAIADKALVSSDFLSYVKALKSGREQVIKFDISKGSWTTSRDLYTIAQLKSGAYVQVPHEPYVLSDGQGIRQSDVYNYLYCKGLVGIDCSGFVWQTLCYVADKAKVDLPARFRRILGAPSGDTASYYVGTSFYNSKSSVLETVDDKIENLRPGDILLFITSDGTAIHSAIIQSVDFEKGIIRYMQSTDEAPADERGVHESEIDFDPAHPEVSLKDPSVNWTQLRPPPFPGEMASPYNTDGSRFRAFPEKGGGKVVRLKMLASLKFPLPSSEVSDKN
jgi:hypothetical protein